MNIHTLYGEFNLKSSMSAIQGSDYTGQKNGCAYRKIPREGGNWGISHVHYMSHSCDIFYLYMGYIYHTWLNTISAISNQQYNTYNVSWEFLYSTWIPNMFKTSQLVRSGQFPSLYMRVSSLCWASTNLSQARIWSGYKLQSLSFCTVQVFGTSSVIIIWPCLWIFGAALS